MDTSSLTDLHIVRTQSSPEVAGRVNDGILELSGDSYPENSFDFFAPVMAWLESFLGSSQAPLTLELHLLYLNTSSVKVMIDIFDLLEEAHNEGREVAVNWYYDAENERIAELAEEFKEDCTFPFGIIARPER